MHESLVPERKAESAARGEDARFEEEAKERYERILLEPEVKEALSLLDELPPEFGLVYHVKGHTLDVIRETVLFAVADGMPYETIKQQAIAAAWHDVGYTESMVENESTAIEKFKKSAAYARMTTEDISETIGNIWDTRVVQGVNGPAVRMQNSALGYMLDGDLSNFGRDDFKEKMAEIAEEIRIDLSDPVSKKKYYENTLALLRNHEWRTEAAKRLRDNMKQENIAWLEEECRRLENEETT